MKNLILKIATISLLSPIVTSVANAEITPHGMKGEENLKGILITKDGITVNVYSGGCTSKNSFLPATTRSIPPHLTFFRIKEDGCRAHLPFGISMDYTWEELNVNMETGFFVTNPIELGLIRG